MELSNRQMKDVIGGGGPYYPIPDLDSVKHCFIDGELIFETICTTHKECRNLYGDDAICY